MVSTGACGALNSASTSFFFIPGPSTYLRKRNLNETDLALRYEMSFGVCTKVSSVDSLKVVRQNLKIAGFFASMSAREKSVYQCRPREGERRVVRGVQEPRGTRSLRCRRQHCSSSQEEGAL